MLIRSKENYYHSMTKQRILTEGKTYEVIRSHKDSYTVRNDNNKISNIRKEVFEIV